MVGKEVSIKVQDDGNHIFLFYRNENIGLHMLEHHFKGGYITSPSHYLAIKQIMQAQVSSSWKSKEKSNKKIIEESIVRTTSFDSRQVIQLFDEVQSRDLNVYAEVM